MKRIWAAVTAAIAITAAQPAQAIEYDVLAIHTGGGALSQLATTVPSVNNAGTVAFAELVFDPVDTRNEYVVFRSDGAPPVPVLNLTDAIGPGVPTSLVINDAGVIAVNYSLGDQAAIVRIGIDGSFVVLAQADRLGGTPYLEFAAAISMNSAGQVAALVTNLDSTSSIVRLDDRDPIVVEIARSAPLLSGFSSPSINDAEVVAFRAQGPSPGSASIYTGSGGPLTHEGTVDPCNGSSDHAVVIGNDGSVLSDCGALSLFVARGGSVTVVLSGTEDPIFARLASGYSANNLGVPAFVTTAGDGSPEVGLFTGSDPIGSKVVRTGDIVLGLTVENIRMGHRSINDRGQMVFLLQLGGSAASTSHVVLATPRRMPQAISFPALASRPFGAPPFAVSATASSGLPVTFAASGSCSVAGAMVTILRAGFCTVVASQSGNATFLPAEVSQTFTVAVAGQLIAFDPLPDRTFGDPLFPVSATASSGLPVALTATGTCSIAESMVTLTGAGSCTVTAAQGGSADYEPAPAIARTFAIARASQTIAFPALSDRRLGDPPFTVAAVASSGLPVSFTAGGSCSVEGTTVSPIAPGPCTITASQDGTADFDAAPAVARSFMIAAVLLDARFDAGPGSFAYAADTFRSTSEPRYARGAWTASGGLKGGAVQISLGGVDDVTAVGISGGWQTTFDLSVRTKTMLHVRVNMTQTADYESDEASQLLVSVDGVLVGSAPNDYVAQLAGDGNGGVVRTTGWRLFHVALGTLEAGQHTLVIGGYNSKKTTATESTTILIDRVVVLDVAAGPQAAVAALDFERFKDNIRILAEFGDRTQGTASYLRASNWVESQLIAAGYTVERHPYTYLGQSRYSISATRVGTAFPDHMYIVSAHLDGRGGGGAANDDASGCSLVLEAARALAGVETAASVRFIFWNNEETGLNGSTAYANERAARQGVESPPGSGRYPEPRWLGIIQHDQILFDHGLPPQPQQIAGADIDVEYQASSTFAAQARVLAHALRAGNQTYSTDYPAQVGSNMNYTDSVPFRNLTAAISVRDNQRVAEIGLGSNPHWHQPTDVYAAFSEADFRLGFNAVQMTLGTVAELAGAAPMR